jgi:CheY-like chemotaxis protein
MATLLVVDDEASVQGFLAEALRCAGHTVLTASCGRDALQVLRTVPVQLVVTDLYMPEENGFELLRLIRQEFPATRTIGLSGGFASEPLLKVAEIVGADEALSKPLGIAELLSAVNRVLALPPP